MINQAKETVFITGHQNPDMDSIAAAYALAELNNQLDKTKEYVPVALGPLNEITKGFLKSIEVDAPVLLKDVYTRVKDVYKRTSLVLSGDEPVIQLVNMYNQSNPSVIPIIDSGEFKGLLSVDDINRYFLSEHLKSRPVYDFFINNIPRVLPGFFLKKPTTDVCVAPIMIGAMRFDVYKRRLALCDVKPMLIVGCRQDHIDLAIKEQLPGIILIGVEESSLEGIDFSSYNGFVYVSYEDTSETIRLLRLSVPVIDVLNKREVKKIDTNMLFDQAKRVLSDSDMRGLPVFDQEKFVGFITRRCFLDKPKKKLILVDHNEVKQSVKGIEEADILQIVDHHRLDAPKTNNPISIISSPVGSTCTIIYDLFQRYHITISLKCAKMLLAGITADTIMLQSPTTTQDDKVATEDLLHIANVDYKEFSSLIFTEGAVLSLEGATSAINSDFKVYKEEYASFGIGQVEVSSTNNIADVKDHYIKELELVKKQNGLDIAMLLVTNVFKHNSILICTSFKNSYRFMYESLFENVYNLPGVLSRKKQLMPEVIRILEN